MRFTSRGIASACAGRPFFPSGGFTADLLLEPDGPRLQRAGELISFYDGDEVIIDAYHWRDRVIVSSTNMHKYEAGAKSVLTGKKRTLISVSAGKGGIWVYANGRKMGGTHRPFKGIERARCFILGNSPDGRMPWQGRLLSLSLSEKENPNRDVLVNGAGFLNGADGSELVAQYSFKGSGAVVNSAVTDAPGISVPERFRPAKMRWLEPLFSPYRIRLNAWDVIINFLGFIPGGFLFFFLRSNGSGAARTVLAVLAGFFLSLGIETSQVFIPERYSQLSDLILNTAGAAFGAVAASFSTRVMSRLID